MNNIGSKNLNLLPAALALVVLLVALPIYAAENQSNSSPSVGGSSQAATSQIDNGSSTPSSITSTSPASALEFTVSHSSPIAGIVGLTPEADVTAYASVCAVWTLISNSGESRNCYGDPGCCDYVGMEAKWSQWNTAFYLTRGSDGVEEANLVTVQLFASKVDISADTSAVEQSPLIRLSVIIPDTTSTESPSVQVIAEVQQLQGVYVELPDSAAPEANSDVSVEVGSLTQGEAQIGIPVSWYQQLVLRNTGTADVDYSLSLWNLGRQIGIDFLNDVQDFSMSVGGEVISETSVALLKLAPGEEKIIDITYLTPPAMMDKQCSTVSISDLLPKGAVVTSAELPLSTPVMTVCQLRIYHNTIIHYQDIKVNLNDMDPNTITSVYYVEGNTLLNVEDGIINVPPEEN